MASITITIPDSVVTRLRLAFRSQASDPPATISEIEGVLKAFLKSKVINHETTVEAELKRDAVSRENWE